MDERRTSPVELLWDLVFVFAVTQTTTLLAHDLTWKGFGQGMLVLALVWWAWSAYVWAANAEQEGSRALRAVLLVGMVFIFIAGLALPHAWGDRATLFACAYAGVRLLHLASYAHASRRGQASWTAIAGFAVTVVVGMALLIGGSFLDEGPRALTWTLAVALGLLATIGMWWTYFDRFAATAEERLREHDDPVLAAADGYSYLHLVIVAGIIVFAVGMKATIHSLGEPLDDAARLALCGGVALYLVGNAAFRLRIASEVAGAKLAGAVVLLGVFALGGGLSGLWVAGAATIVLAALCGLEALQGEEPAEA